MMLLSAIILSRQGFTRTHPDPLLQGDESIGPKEYTSLQNILLPWIMFKGTGTPQHPQACIHGSCQYLSEPRKMCQLQAWGMVKEWLLVEDRRVGINRVRKFSLGIHICACGLQRKCKGVRLWGLRASPCVSVPTVRGVWEFYI